MAADARCRFSRADSRCAIRTVRTPFSAFSTSSAERAVFGRMLAAGRSAMTGLTAAMSFCVEFLHPGWS
jgi:hypothetical protein